MSVQGDSFNFDFLTCNFNFFTFYITSLTSLQTSLASQCHPKLTTTPPFRVSRDVTPF